MILADINGKAIWQKTPGGTGSIQIPAHHLAPGVYLFEISGNAGSFVQILVKE